jgi:hypothetical protein
MSQVIYNVAQISLRQAITPPEMQSRMNATMRFIVWGTIPIGSLMGGALASVAPLRVALILAAAASFTSIVPALASPLRSLREMPGVNGEAQPTDGETMGVISVETTGETEGVAAGVAEREAAAEALPEAIVAGAAHKEAGLPWTGSPAVDRRLGRD